MPASEMTDEELIEQFEDASIPEDCFHHPQHVRVAFLYLCRYPIIETLERFSTALKRFAAAMGKADRYHETITWAHVFLVHERMAGSDQDWGNFASANPDLMSWEDSILKKYYREETLRSERARKGFVLPDNYLHVGSRRAAGGDRQPCPRRFLLLRGGLRGWGFGWSLWSNLRRWSRSRAGQRDGDRG